MKKTSQGARTSRRELLLFLRETQGLPWAPKMQNDVPSKLEVEWQSWRKKRRRFSSEEFADRVWVKTCSQGYVTELHLRPDRTLDEYSLFDRAHVPGSWDVTQQGTLLVALRTATSTYELEAFASCEGEFHSAIEFCEGEIHAYLKLAPLARAARR